MLAQDFFRPHFAVEYCFTFLLFESLLLWLTIDVDCVAKLFQFVLRAMGAAASVTDIVQGLGDQVSADECRTLSKALSWHGDVEDWIDDAFDSDTVPKAKVEHKIAKEQKKLAQKQAKQAAAHARNKQIQREKGERIYAAAMSSQDVQGLSALPPAFRDGVVPRDTAEVAHCILHSFTYFRHVEIHRHHVEIHGHRVEILGCRVASCHERLLRS